MSNVQSTTATTPGATPRRKVERESAGPADGFGAVFAQFARQASMDAGASGRMTLSIGGGAGAGSGSLSSGSGDAPTLAAEDAREKLSASGGAHADRRPEVARGRRDSRGAEHEPRQGTQRAGELPGRPEAHEPGRAHAPDAAPAGGHASGMTKEPGSTSGAAAAPAAAALTALTQRPFQTGAGESGVRAINAVGARGVTGGAQTGANAGLLSGGGERGAQARAAPSATPARESARGEHAGNAFRAQLARGLGAALRRGEGDVTLKLRPETLGELRVRLSVRGSEVDATIRASTHEAHRLLQQSVGSLRAALEARGLHAGRIEIEPVAQDSRHDAGTAQHGAPQHEAGIGQGGEERESAARDASERDRGGGAAGFGSDPQDDGSNGAWASGAMDSPGVVYGVADGAARVVMVDALA